jgi:mRNA interferase MazF
VGKFTVGEVVLVAFPFSNLKGKKLRPALVLAEVEFNNLILCQITSKPYTSHSAIKVTKDDFGLGGLPITSYARPDKLFTAEPSIVTRAIGQLTADRRDKILAKVRGIFSLD